MISFRINFESLRSIEILSDNNLINMKKIGEDRLNNSLIIGLDITRSEVLKK